MEKKENIRDIWQQAKRLTAKYNIVHITADQLGAANRTGALNMRIGLNQTDEEKERGIMRLNVLYNKNRD